MPEPNAPEVPFAGGKVTSSAVPHFHLIPTESLIRLARRFELGVQRKGSGAWNALTQNQEILTDEEFALERISHVIAHANKLRDKIVNGLPFDDDDDAGAISWAGAYLACATQAMARIPLNCSACGGTGQVRASDGPKCMVKCPACRGTGKQGKK